MPLVPGRGQVPYDYTVEVRNTFKGLDLIDRVPDELWNEVHGSVVGCRLWGRTESDMTEAT